MDLIKQAFDRVKQDINLLKSQLQEIKTELQEIKRTQTIRHINQTDRQTNQTHPKSQTDKYPLEASKPQILEISTGNQGVQTDRQTDRQSDRQTQKFAQDNKIDHIEKLSETLDSLDSIKKDLRHKFKKLTSQEMLIFSTIYQLEEQQAQVDYQLIASKLSLSESSIRDYVKNLIKKGVPISKEKQGNKKIFLHIVDDFKKIASLQTILALREL